MKYLIMSFFTLLSLKLYATSTQNLRELKVQFRAQRNLPMGETNNPAWEYQAFHPKDKSIIEKVLKSEGSRRMIEVNSIQANKAPSLDEVDAILYDIGLLEFLKSADPLEREMLIRQAQVGGLQDLLKKYPKLSKEKLRHIHELFH